PTFQAKEAGGVDAAVYARRIAANVWLDVNGRRVRLVAVRHALAFPPGQGGLHTTRLEVLLSGPVLHGSTSVVYHDNNYAGGMGRKEIVVRATGAGSRVATSSAPTKSISDRLLAYPKNLLQSPLDISSARAEVEPGPTAGPPPTLLDQSDLGSRAAVRAVSDG